MADVEFEDNSFKVKQAIESACKSWLYEAAGEVESAVKRGCDSYVDTGQTKNSWQYKVDDSSMEAVIGSDYQNAIWEEFGTGIYSAKGDGRKTPWKYKDAEGKWHRTSGKKARHIFQKAYDSLKNKLKSSLQEKLRGLN